MSRSLSNYNDNSTGVDDADRLIVIFMFVVVIQITYCVTCPGERLWAIGGIKIFLSIIMMYSPYYYVGPDGEMQEFTGGGSGGLPLLGIFEGVIWIIVGQHKIDNRRRIQRDDNFDRANRYFRLAGSQPEEIVPAEEEIVDVPEGSLSSTTTSIIVIGDPQNQSKWNAFGEAECSVPPAACAILETSVREVHVTGMGLHVEQGSNHSEELAISNFPQPNNEQQDQDTLERGMSLFDSYSNREQDEMDIV
jgi:hypothetical protein